MKHTLIVLALCATAAHAEFLDGNDLLKGINASELAERAVALGYIMGVSDSHRGVTHCNVPASVTAGQMRDIVKQHLESNPHTRHQTADVLVSRALTAIWPCPQRGNQRGSGV